MDEVRESGRAGPIAVGSVWIVYPLVFVLLHETAVGDMAAALAFVPAFVSIWLYGLRAAYFVAALIVPLHVALYLLNDHVPGWDMFAGVAGFFGLLAIAFGSLVFGFVVDRLRTTERRLAQTDRHVSVVAHELRNPLAGVLGLSQTLTDTWDDLEPGEARELAGMITEEARTLSAIVTDLLDAGRVRRKALKVEPQPVELDDLVRSIFEEARIVGDPVAWADPLRLGQIVRNLVANARDHGGPPIRLDVWEDDDVAHIEVSDGGDGVPAELINTLFDPFVSRGAPGSTGLGLWLSRALAEAMDGTLEYRRAQGRTIFRLTIPACSSQLACEKLRASRSGAHS